MAAEPKLQLNVRLPKSIIKAIKVMAVQKDTPVNVMLENMIVKHLLKGKKP